MMVVSMAKRKVSKASDNNMSTTPFSVGYESLTSSVLLVAAVSARSLVSGENENLESMC